MSSGPHERVAEVLRQWDLMRDKGDIIYSVNVDPAQDHTADLLAGDLRAVLEASKPTVAAPECSGCYIPTEEDVDEQGGKFTDVDPSCPVHAKPTVVDREAPDCQACMAADVGVMTQLPHICEIATREALETLSAEFVAEIDTAASPDVLNDHIREFTTAVLAALYPKATEGES